MTEPQYLRGLLKWTRGTLLELVISGKHGDPRFLVEQAKAELQGAKEQAVRSKDAYLAYDEAWVVFDRDIHPRFEEACVMARDNGIELAVSNPCFELWLYLHFHESPGAQDRQRMSRLLRDDLPGYGKHVAFEQLAAGLDDATVRAARMLQNVDAPFGNPSTTMFHLTDSIRRV